MAMSTKMAVLWDAAPISLLGTIHLPENLAASIIRVIITIVF
jgi:hypothetical protein